MDLLQELWKTNELLKKALEQYKQRGQEYAQAKRDYRVLVRQEMLKLRSEGVPVTIISDLARGKEEVANAKQNEINTEALYKSCQEAINVYKIQIRIIQSQINAEYTNGDNI